MDQADTMSRREIMQAIEAGDRRTGVLLEKIDDRFDLLLEGYEALDKKIDAKVGALDIKLEHFKWEVDERFRMLFEENQRIFEEMRMMRDKFDEMFRRFDVMEKCFDVLEKRFDILEDRFDFLEKRI